MAICQSPAPLTELPAPSCLSPPLLWPAGLPPAPLALLQMYQECQELLTMFGLPYIIAPTEAEAQVWHPTVCPTCWVMPPVHPALCPTCWVMPPVRAD